MNRRDFMKRCFGILAGSIVLILGGPFLSFLLSPFYQEDKKQKFVKVPDFASIPQECPTKMIFPYIHKDSFLTQNELLDVWVIKHSAMAATVYSPMCSSAEFHKTGTVCRKPYRICAEQGFFFTTWYAE